jgi:UDP-N-acetylmuramyl pentapeptide phosphotransferase/UDP-N-acetylglucosamine-1-phosphate transferase
MQADEKLWDIANYVTGFAIAQVLATSFAIAKRDWPALKGAAAHCLAMGGSSIFTTFYLTVIIWCCNKGSTNSSITQELWQRITQGRILAVLLFTFVLIVALIGHWRDDQSQTRS